MEEPEVSVIICVFNGEDVVREQLEALAGQKVDFAWEVVVANNRSTDSTQDVLEVVAKSYPVELRIVSADEKQGVGYARNCAAIASRGRILAFCDADDQVGGGWLDVARQRLNDSDVVGGPLRELRVPFEVDAPLLPSAHLHVNAFGTVVPGGNFAVRRAAFFEIGGFDESFPPYGMEDVDFSARANGMGFVVESAPNMVAYFRPTRSARPLLRKAYLSAQAEFLIWSRYPDSFHKTDLIGDVKRTGARMVESIRQLVSTRDGRHVNSAARAVVTLWGHSVARLRYRTGTLSSKPVLLSPEDGART